MKTMVLVAAVLGILLGTASAAAKYMDPCYTDNDCEHAEFCYGKNMGGMSKIGVSFCVECQGPNADDPDHAHCPGSR